MNKTKLKELVDSLTEEEAKQKLTDVAIWALEMSQCSHHLCSLHESFYEEITSDHIFKILRLKIENKHSR